jgi:hypothetical protein
MQESSLKIMAFFGVVENRKNETKKNERRQKT